MSWSEIRVEECMVFLFYLTMNVICSWETKKKKINSSLETLSCKLHACGVPILGTKTTLTFLYWP